MTTHSVKTLEEFDQDLASMHITGQWKYDAMIARLTDGPKPVGVPYLWKWDAVYAKLLEACAVMPESFTARRNFTFNNPGLGDRPGTTHTIVGGPQIVMPGEVAWAHRHTIGALRFAIQGNEKLYTVVDGEVFPMEPNDLILTPNWSWHDHHNESDDYGIWLDVLDVPLTLWLNQTFYEPLGETVQPVRERRADYVSARAGFVRPTWEERRSAGFPLRYPWREVRETLFAHAETAGSPHDGVLLEYVNPVTGGPALPTLGCYVQLLRSGLETQPHRHTSSTFYYVVEGEGTTVAGETELDWSERDFFAVPNWTRHHHRNRSKTGNAILFSVTDEPVLAALGFLREEPDRSTYRQRPPAIPAERARKD